MSYRKGQEPGVENPMCTKLVMTESAEQLSRIATPLGTVTALPTPVSYGTHIYDTCSDTQLGVKTSISCSPDIDSS